MKRKLLALLALGMLFLISFSIVSMGGQAKADTALGLLRVIHASPGAGPVDIYVNGTKLLPNVPYATLTPYVPVPVGTYAVQVVPAGQDISKAIITQSVTVSPSAPYTAAALGTTSSSFSLGLYADNNVIQSGQAAVRVYHLSPDAGPVNVSTGGTTVISGLTYPNVSNYLTVAPGSYTFGVTLVSTGTSVPLNATLNANTITSVFAIGLAAGSGTTALQLKTQVVSGVSVTSTPTPAPANSAYVRIVHAAPGAGPVDVFVDGKQLLANFAFGTVTSYEIVPAGSHTVQVAPAGQGIARSVITTTATVDANMSYTVAALGTTSFSLKVFVDDNTAAGGKAKLRLYQLSPGVSTGTTPITVSMATGGSVLVPGQYYPYASNYVTIPPVAYSFDVTIGTTHVALNATLPPNTITSVFALGLLNGTGSTAFKLVAVQVPALPGLPGTGNDPNALVANNGFQPINAWTVGVLILVILGTSAVTMRRRLSK